MDKNPTVSLNKGNRPSFGSNTANYRKESQSKDSIINIPMQIKENKNEKDDSSKAEDDGHGSVDHPTSYAETLMHLLRGNIGSGVMAMGDAIKNAGILFGPPVVLLLGLITVHCQHQLLNAAEEMKRRTGMSFTPGFAQTVELCFSTGHPSMKKFAPTMKLLVNLFLCVTQLGFCCVYFVFISTNIKQVMDYYGISVDLHLHMAVILLPILLTCLVRNLKYLAPFSTFANLVMLIGIVITLYFVTRDLPNISSRNYIANLNQIPLFFGTALFAFEGIGLVLPLRKEMKEPEHFARPLGVLNVGMTFVTLLYTTLGFLAYLKFGEEIQGSVTLNLPLSDILSQVVKVIISLGILLTFALQFYIPVVIIWPGIAKKLGPFRYPVLAESVFRSALVLITFTLAEVIPYLGLFISLVGAVSSTALALIFPPILELAIKWTVSEVSVVTVVKNTFILILGIVGCFTGTYESIQSIVAAIATAPNYQT